MASTRSTPPASRPWAAGKGRAALGSLLLALTALTASGAGSAAPTAARDPFQAYAAGRYDQALQGFVDRRLEDPDDPRLAINVGSAYYKMNDFDAAAQAFANAATADDPALREQALYSLGNVAYRQGRLPEAVELYQRALEVDPNDEDAKYNLELVRDEIRRREEEAKKQQIQQNQQQDQSPNEQQPNEQQKKQDQQQDRQDQQGQQGQQDQQGQQSQAAADQQTGAGEDHDQDGLPDEVERNGENPTDPSQADSDGDGLKDGEEDRNHNGRRDPGETDPNRADSDGDGQLDGAEAAAAAGGESGGQMSGQMSKEMAEQLLAALDEGRPLPPQRARGRRTVAGGKDW